MRLSYNYFRLMSFLLLLGATAQCVAPVAAQSPTKQLSSELEKLIPAEMKAAGIPGAAIGVVSRGKMIFAKGFGVSSVEDGSPVTPATVFRLGSTTKMFTAAVLVQMALDKKLDLNKPIGEYVSELDAAIAALTTHQLLSHMSGLRSNDISGNRSDESALAREVKSWGPQRSFTVPGEVFSYSGDGYWLAGYVAETVTGEPYATLMQHQLFEPLKMTRTTFRMVAAITYPVAQGHRSSGGKLAVVRPMPDNPASWPAISSSRNHPAANISELEDMMADILHDFPIKAPIDRVFAAVSAPEGLDCWWTKQSEGKPIEGEEYRLFFGPQHDWRAKVTRCLPNSEFELEMVGADKDWIGTRVGLRLEDRGEATWVRFHHVGWHSENEHYRISCNCWAMYLRILRRHLEHGESVPYESRLDV